MLFDQCLKGGFLDGVGLRQLLRGGSVAVGLRRDLLRRLPKQRIQIIAQGPEAFERLPENIRVGALKQIPIKHRFALLAESPKGLLKVIGIPLKQIVGPRHCLLFAAPKGLAGVGLVDLVRILPLDRGQSL